MAMRTKHFPKEDNSTKVLKHLVSYKSAKCCPPLGEGVGKDLPLKNVGKKSMDPVAALQDDAGQGRRCP